MAAGNDNRVKIGKSILCQDKPARESVDEGTPTYADNWIAINPDHPGRGSGKDGA
jgi:hypothetical protein